MYFWRRKFSSINVLFLLLMTFSDETGFIMYTTSPKVLVNKKLRCQKVQLFKLIKKKKTLLVTKPFCHLMFFSPNTLFGNEIVSLPNVFFFIKWRRTISSPKPNFFFYSAIFGDEIFRCWNQFFIYIFNFSIFDDKIFHRQNEFILLILPC